MARNNRDNSLDRTSLVATISDPSNENNNNFTTVKTTLDSIVLPNFREKVKEHISDLAIKGTQITALSSLLVLLKLNRALDVGNLNYFEQDYFEDVIKVCFKGAISSNTNIDEDFIELIEKNNVTKPNTNNMGNSLKYLIELYKTSFENTNSLSHARRRFRAYFRTIPGKKERGEIESTITYILCPNSRVAYNDDLMRSLSEIGLGERDRGFFAKRNFFQNICAYFKMQRKIEWFNSKQEDNKKRIHNFSIVPIFGFRRQHVRIDKDMFYRILTKCGTLSVPGKRGMKNMQYRDIKENKRFLEEVGRVFNLEKIKQMGGKNKEFQIHFMSDGVAASILYKRGRKKTLQGIREVKRKLILGKYFFAFHNRSVHFFKSTKK